MKVSEINTSITLEQLTKSREDQYFERKGLGEKNIKPSKIAEELIGMLNADGGILVFGVSDGGELQNVEILGDKLSDYRNLIIDFIEPYTKNVVLEEIRIKNSLIFLYHVEQDIERLYEQKQSGNIYLRVDDRNKHLKSLSDIRTLEFDKQIRKYEDEVEPNFDFEDLDIPIVEKYKEELEYTKDIMELLYTRNVVVRKAGEYKMKRSGVLLFAKQPEKYIPNASLRYVRYNGVGLKAGSNFNVVKDISFEENIPRIIEKVKTFMHAALDDFYFLDIEYGVFRKIPEYPEEAWLEGVVNALCHRSYNVHGNPIMIKHFDDRIEISNSGPLPAQVTVENIRSERYSRNPRIARVLKEMGFVRQLNEGVARIYESMERSMLSEPEYSEKNKYVYLTLRNKVSVHAKTVPETVHKGVQDNWGMYNDSQRRILTYLYTNIGVTIDELRQNLEIHDKTIRLYLKQFIEENVVERHSEKTRDKNAVYTFKGMLP
ncbi:MAG: ATP-binding protein [Bacteroidales bacterium]